MTPELKYYSYIAKDIVIGFKDSVGLNSILELYPTLVRESAQIEVDYNDTFLKVVYRRMVERKDWINKLETFHVKLIPIHEINKIDVDI